MTTPIVHETSRDSVDRMIDTERRFWEENPPYERLGVQARVEFEPEQIVEALLDDPLTAAVDKVIAAKGSSLYKVIASVDKPHQRAQLARHLVDTLIRPALIAAVGGVEQLDGATPAPWFLVEDDEVGGWAVSQADVPSSERPIEAHEPAQIVEEADGRLIAALRNLLP